MRSYIQNLKRNAIYTVIVGMIISLPMIMFYDNLTDESICHEKDYKGDIEKCIKLTENGKKYGWLFFLFPIGMALMSGLFHFFPEVKAEVKDKKPLPEFVLPFILSAIAMLFVMVATDLISEENIQNYSQLAPIIPVAIFVCSYRSVNGHWFWQEKKNV